MPVGGVMLDGFANVDAFFRYGQNVGSNSPRVLHDWHAACRPALVAFDRCGSTCRRLFKQRTVHRLACRVVAVEQIHRSWFYLTAFLLTYQVATLFDDIRLIGRGLFSVVLAA